MAVLTIGLTLLAVVWAVVGIVVWCLLVDRRHPVLGVLAGCAAIGAAAVSSIAAGSGVVLGTFGIVHGFYLAAVVSIPLLGVAVLVGAVVRSRRGSGPVAVGAVAAGVALVVPALVGVYATHIAPFQLRVQHVQVPVPPGRTGHDTIRIAVLSDLQTVGVGDLERQAVAAAMAAEPDLILLPGDLFQADGETLQRNGPGLRELLSELHAPGGVFLVEGDVDAAERLAVVVPPNVTMLDDRIGTVTVGDRTVAIGGTRARFDGRPADELRRELIDEPEGTVRILLSHRPDTVLRLPSDADVDLTVAGHTHGGQVALPGIGPLITLTDVPRTVAAGGLHQVHGNRIYVSPGIGMERHQAPQIRFGVPPTVGIVDLG